LFNCFFFRFQAVNDGFLIFKNNKSIFNSFFQKLLIDINLAEKVEKRNETKNVSVCSFFNLLFDCKPFRPD